MPPCSRTTLQSSTRSSVVANEPGGIINAVERPKAPSFMAWAIKSFIFWSAAVLEQQPIGVRVHVDKAGCDHEAARVDFALGFAFHAADSDNSVIFHRHVAIEPWIASAIDDLSLADGQIVLRLCALDEMR